MAVAPQLYQSNGLTVLAFAPDRLGVFGMPARQAGQFDPVAPSLVLQLSGAVAALDGPIFTTCSGQAIPASPESARYAASRCASPDFLVFDARRGVNLPGRRPTDGVTIAVVNGVARVARGSIVPEGASVAVQLWPPLVLEGQNVASASLNTESTGRAALAVLSDGRLAFVVGRGPMRDFAEALRGIGARYAGYTDGGGSTALVDSGGRVHGSGASVDRRVPTWLVVEPAGSALPWLIALAVGLGAWLYLRPGSQT